MMRERKLLAIKAARFMRRHPDKVLDKKTGEPVPVSGAQDRRGRAQAARRVAHVGRARQARALQAPRRAAREESGPRAAQEPAQNAQGREDLPRRPGLRQRGRPRRRGAPRGDPRGPVPPTAQGRLVRRLPGYVNHFITPRRRPGAVRFGDRASPGTAATHRNRRPHRSGTTASTSPSRPRAPRRRAA